MAVPQLRTHFKTAEGRYRLAAENFHQLGISNVRTLKCSKMTLAVLRGAGDIDGAYLIFNIYDALIIIDRNAIDKDPVKVIIFSGVQATCHAYTPHQTADGYDLLIGFSSGEVCVASLRQQLLDPSRKLVGAQTYNRDGALNISRCTNVLWSPRGDTIFVSTHADGCLYIYDKTKDVGTEPTFPPIKDPAAFQISYAKSSKACPMTRWHVCPGAINAAAFSPDGTLLACAGRDGCVRVFDFARGALFCGGRSYYGSVLSMSWSRDARFIALAGEDDLVNIYSMVDKTVVAWGEGHSSWVSHVAFDHYFTKPQPAAGTEAAEGYNPDLYRIISVAQDCQIGVWEFSSEDITLSGGLPRSPLLLPSPAAMSYGGHPTSPAMAAPLSNTPPTPTTPTSSTAFHRRGSSLTNNDVIASPGTLAALIAAAPGRADVLRVPPVVLSRVHTEPLSGLLITENAVLTCCQGGQVKLWARPQGWGGS
ncbi:hypothetical protein CYMTET_43593 [Cymbomonas tetramitiformis]|uniref:WD40 repeat-like protein n=1 Tax=Cymbomonas tetramitiformis TaxID=36881 RepID=A0AAE0C1U9_9CHLO|nr:hypothetical protein CYMTET_43594 [Cymbomonas tetramitiformis]KAK3246889.1 hypothetical protein CYMTET_43593 [Cymbomonas tetramitiformis]